MPKTWNERLTREMPLTTAMQAEIDELRAKSEMDDAMLTGNGALITELLAKLAETKEALELAQLQTSSTLSKMLDVQAKLAALEAQPHSATLHDDGYWTWNGSPPYESQYAGWRLKVYLAAGAAMKGQS